MRCPTGPYTSAKHVRQQVLSAELQFVDGYATEDLEWGSDGPETANGPELCPRRSPTRPVALPYSLGVRAALR